MNGSAYQNRLSIISEYSRWLAKVMEKGIGDQIWYGSYMTLMFDHIPGSFELKLAVMSDEAERVYRTLVPHVVRILEGLAANPSFQSGLSLQIIQSRKAKVTVALFSRMSVSMTGLHLNGVMLLRTDTRLPVTPAMHFEWKGPWYKEYVRPGFPLRRIDVRTISETPEKAADYSLKTLKSRIPDLDKLLIFPKSLSELSIKRPGVR